MDTSSKNPAAINDAKNESKSVHLVVQRYRSCRILVDESDWISVGASPDTGSDDNANKAINQDHCGLVVYVSFANTANKKAVRQAALTVAQLPVMTTGQWGDGVSGTSSILQLAALANGSASLVLIPQANLISKVRGQGRSIQYHGQISKEKGEQLYHYFVDCMRGLLLEEQHRCSTTTATASPPAEPLPKWYTDWKTQHEQPSSNAAIDPSIPPHQIFRLASMENQYGSWEEDTGLPLTTSDGAPLTKSAVKKARKLRETHAKRHAKWKTKNNNSSSGDGPLSAQVDAVAISSPNLQIEESEWQKALNKNFCHVVAGSFGKRQGLELQSDMGPFCHVFQV